MAAVTVFTGEGRQGRSRELGEGVFVIDEPHSFWVSNGYRARFHDSADGRIGGGIGHTQWFYPQTNDSYNAGRPLPGRQPHMRTVEAEKTTLGPSGLVVLYCDDPTRRGGPIPFALGPGDHEYQSGPDAGEFPNDIANRVFVPDNCQVTLYDAGGESGSRQTFGDPGLHPVAHGVSSVTVTMDEWEVIGVPVVDYDGGHERVVGVTTERAVATNHNDFEEPIEVGFEKTIEEHASVNWNVSSATGVSVEAEASPFGVGAKAGLSETITIGAGGDKGHSVSRTLRRTAHPVVPANSTVWTTLILHDVEGTFPTRRTWRNKRTGATFVQDGMLKTDFAGDDKFDFGKAQPLPA